MIRELVRRLFSSGHQRSLRAPNPIRALDTRALVAPASDLLEQGRPDDAIAVLESLLHEHHDLAEAHLLLGTILHGRQQFEDAQDSYALAQCFKPHSWPIYFQIGLLALDRGQPSHGAAALSKALELGADDARVHSALGRAYLERGQVRDSVEQFERAIALEPSFVEAHSNLGYVLFHHMEEFEDGAKHIEHALRLDPSHIAAQCNLCMVLQHQGRVDEALALCNELLLKQPHLHEARVNRASILLNKGDFATGWRDYEARRQWPAYYQSEHLPWPEWDGSSLQAKKIFVYAEQGLGDEIMFSSCVPQLLTSARSCVLECHPKLAPIFRRSFPTATVVRKSEWQEADFLADPPDCKIALGSLPKFMRGSSNEFPDHRGYLHADADRVQHWRRRLDALPGSLKVGISWRGGAPTTRRSLRSIPLPSWLPILRVPGVDFINLQYSDCAQELADLCEETDVQLHSWQCAIDDYDETAALVGALDLVISVQTAIVHLTGALGKPVWALIPSVPEWRYGAAGHRMPWYPTARLFRQVVRGVWEPLITSVRENVDALVRQTAPLKRNRLER
jgi:tetratricopeptide (TPR) repeat protein